MKKSKKDDTQQSLRLHPDGRPVSETPKITFYAGECQETEKWEWDEAIECARYMERRAREAEAHVSELEAERASARRVIWMLRSYPRSPATETVVAEHIRNFGEPGEA